MRNYDKYINKLMNFYKSKNIKTPITVSYEITNRCNLLCEHCYNRNKNNSIHNHLLLSEKIMLLEKLRKMGTEEIIVCGGEPFIENDIFDFISYAKKLDFRLIILTNGVLIDGKTIEFLKKILTDEDYIQLSIDEYFENDIHLQRNISAVQNEKIRICLQGMHDMEVPVVVNITPTKLNQNFILDIVTAISNIGLTRIGFTPYVPMGGIGADKIKPDYTLLSEIEKEVIELHKERKIIYLDGLSGHPCQKDTYVYKNSNEITHTRLLRSCIASEYNIHISCSGKIYPCVFLEDEDFYIGNIRETESEIKGKMNIVYNKIVSPFPEKCKSCNRILECNGGCIGLIVDRYGNNKNVDPRCAR